MKPSSGERADRVESNRRRRTGLPVFGAALLALSAGSTGPVRGGIVELAAALDRPVAGAPVPAPAAIEVGRARLVPGASSSIRPLFAGDERCGIWIEGPGELRYTVSDPFSVPVAKRNLKSASRLAVEESGGGLVVREPFDGALVWSWDLGAGGGPEPGAPLPEWGRTALDLLLVSPPGHDLLQARATKQTGLAFALVHGRQGDLLLSVDPTPDVQIENLGRLKKVEASRGVLAGRLTFVSLVTQPVGRAWSQPPGGVFGLVSGDVSVTETGEENARIEARLVFRSSLADLALLRLDFPEALYENGKKYPVSLERVEVGGSPAAHVHRGGDLLVELPKPLGAGETVELAVAYSGRFAAQPAGNRYWSLAWDDWLPMPAPLAERHGSWHLTVRSRDPLLPFASGEVVAARREGDFHLLETRLDGPFRSVALGAGKYDVEEVRGDDGSVVRVASYVFAKPRQRKLLANNLLAARQAYERLFGVQYPFRDVDIIEVYEWGFGMAPPGVVFITREAFDPASIIRMRGAEWYVEGVDHRFLHEVAHAWWAHVVQYPSGDEQWLSESFSEYASALCLAALLGGKAGEIEFEKLHTDWKNWVGGLEPGASLFLANRLAFDDDRDRSDRFRLLYAKGPLVIHAIRRELARQRGGAAEGDRYFFAFLKSVVKNFDRKPSSTRHLAGILGQMTGADWRPFFDRYVYGTEMPPFD